MKYQEVIDTDERPMRVKTPKAKLSQKTIDLLTEDS